MSVSYRSILFLGVPVTRELFWTTTEQYSGCPKHGKLDSYFCPTCGLKTCGLKTEQPTQALILLLKHRGWIGMPAELGWEQIVNSYPAGKIEIVQRENLMILGFQVHKNELSYYDGRILSIEPADIVKAKDRLEEILGNLGIAQEPRFYSYGLVG